ncbi:hypothetical protein AKJ16_DCAP07692 [Drosera capensis]
MGVSKTILAVVAAIDILAFLLAVGAESRRSTGKVVPDEYDERTYCAYDSDASTAYGLSAFGLLLISQTVVNAATKCLCFGKGLSGGSTVSAVFFFVFSCIALWVGFAALPVIVVVSLNIVEVMLGLVTFLGAEACLLAGSARNAYHTRYRGIFSGQEISCATLRKGVFAAAAAMTLLSMIGSILYYWSHSKADTGGWEKHRNEGGLGMTSSAFTHQDQQQQEQVTFGKGMPRQG